MTQDKACPSVLQYYLHLIPLFYSNWKSKENEIAVLFFESSASQNHFFFFHYLQCSQDFGGLEERRRIFKTQEVMLIHYMKDEDNFIIFN